MDGSGQRRSDGGSSSSSSSTAIAEKGNLFEPKADDGEEADEGQQDELAAEADEYAVLPLNLFPKGRHIHLVGWLFKIRKGRGSDEKIKTPATFVRACVVHACVFELSKGRRLQHWVMMVAK